MPFIIIAFMILGGSFLVIMYNRLVSLSNARAGSFANIDVLLRKRQTLVDRLVETVSGYMGHEDKVLTLLTAARTKVTDSTSSQDLDSRLNAESNLSKVLDHMRLTVENYPDLKASQNFILLQEELSKIEADVAGSRREFNSVTQAYNTFREQWPASMVAKWNNFGPAAYFQLSEEERKSFSKPASLEF